MTNPSAPLRVLMIDDDKDWYDLVSIVLATSGYQPDYAGTMDEARQKLSEAAQNGIPYRLATIDMNFKLGAGVSAGLGRQILRHIKQDYPHIACVMLSGSEVLTPEVILDLRDDYGLDYFVQKDRLFSDFAVNFDLLTHAIDRATKRTAPPEARPQVFLSYMRKVTWAHARAIGNSLRERGVDVFLDFDSINQGRFDTEIKRQIKQRDFFVPILAPETLIESDWVVIEIMHALVLEKQVIPLLVNGFDFTKHTVPQQIAALGDMNAITVNGEFYEQAMDKLVERFLT